MALDPLETHLLDALRAAARRARTRVRGEELWRASVLSLERSVNSAETLAVPWIGVL